MTPFITKALMASLLATAPGVPRYDIDVRFASDMRSLKVTGELVVPRSLTRRDTLELRLSALFRGLRFTENGRAVNLASIGDTTGDRRNYRLIVPGSGDTVRLQFSYS